MQSQALMRFPAPDLMRRARRGLSGAALADSSGQDNSPLIVGEALQLVRFDRDPGVPTWKAFVVRSNGKWTYLPLGAAVRLGLTDHSVYDTLVSSVDSATLQEEVKRMAVQAALDKTRHKLEVLDNLNRWAAAYWYGPAGLVLGALEEVMPGAGAQVAEDLLNTLCRVPATALPAAVLGACSEGDRSPWWVTPVLVLGASVGTLILLEKVGVLARFARS